MPALTLLLFTIAGAILRVRGTCLLGKTDFKETAPLNEPGLFIDLDQPAQCDGFLTQWNLCYYNPSNAFHGGSLPVELQVWRFNNDLTEGIKVVEYEVNVSIPEVPNRFQCIEIEVPEMEMMEVNVGDYLGVWIFENATLPVVKYSYDFRHLLAAPTVTFRGVPSLVRFPSSEDEYYTALEGVAIHLTANITAENVSLIADEIPADSTQEIITIVVGAVAGLELVILIAIILVLVCACRFIKKKHTLYKECVSSKIECPENVRPKPPQIPSLRSYLEPRTSQFYDTIDDVYSVHEFHLTTTPTITTTPNLSYHNHIEVKLNESYRSLDPLPEEDNTSEMEDNEAYNEVRNVKSGVISEDRSGTAEADRDSKVSYAYPSQRGVFIVEASEEDSGITMAEGESVSNHSSEAGCTEVERNFSSS